jgi:alpha-galactosidase
VQNGFMKSGPGKFSGPGHWNDYDLLMIGVLSGGQKTRLTPNEQITHFTLWCLLSSPLLISCDLSKMDEFTLALLCNDEVIAIDQDPLGQSASRVYKKDFIEVWSKPLADGNVALGIFNLGINPRAEKISWRSLGIPRPNRVRELWIKRDLDSPHEEFRVNIPGHGVVLYKVFQGKRANND